MIDLFGGAVIFWHSSFKSEHTRLLLGLLVLPCFFSYSLACYNITRHFLFHLTNAVDLVSGFPFGNYRPFGRTAVLLASSHSEWASLCEQVMELGACSWIVFCLVMTLFLFRGVKLMESFNKLRRFSSALGCWVHLLSSSFCAVRRCENRILLHGIAEFCQLITPPCLAFTSLSAVFSQSLYEMELQLLQVLLWCAVVRKITFASFCQQCTSLSHIMAIFPLHPSLISV